MLGSGSHYRLNSQKQHVCFVSVLSCWSYLFCCTCKSHASKDSCICRCCTRRLMHLAALWQQAFWLSAVKHILTTCCCCRRCFCCCRCSATCAFSASTCALATACIADQAAMGTYLEGGDGWCEHSTNLLMRPAMQESRGRLLQCRFNLAALLWFLHSVGVA